MFIFFFNRSILTHVKNACSLSLVGDFNTVRGRHSGLGQYLIERELALPNEIVFASSVLVPDDEVDQLLVDSAECEFLVPDWLLAHVVCGLG